jgi:ABC-type transporter Mla maintaining outer membrane lipid asymmetry ATPase subunit MlaF
VTSQTIITLIMRLRDTQGVTSLLATHRLQDAFGLANYKFDAKSNRVLAMGKNGADSYSEATPPTNILVLREGRVYFEGDQHAFLDSPDEYLQRFLAAKDEK